MNPLPRRPAWEREPSTGIFLTALSCSRLFGSGSATAPIPFEEAEKETRMKEQTGRNDRVEVLGIELEWKLRRNDTVDQYCVLAATMPPGAGVPLHQHPQQEAFFILEGEPEFAVENGAGLAWKTVKPGDLVNIPSDALHGFRNVSAGNVRVLLTCVGELGTFF